MKLFKFLFLAIATVACVPQERQEKTTDTPVGNYPTNQTQLDSTLEQTRELMKEINSIKSWNWSAKDKRAIQNDSIHGGAIYYFLHKKIRLINFWNYQTGVKSEIYFYTENDSIRLATEVIFDSLTFVKDKEFYEPSIDSAFFQSNKIILLKSNLDCGAPFSDEYIESQQKRFLDIFRLSNNRLHRL